MDVLSKTNETEFPLIPSRRTADSPLVDVVRSPEL